MFGLKAAVKKKLAKMIGKSKNTPLFLAIRVLFVSLSLLNKGTIIRFGLRLSPRQLVHEVSPQYFKCFP